MSVSGKVVRRGESWEARYRTPQGKQTRRALGKVWTKKSAPPEGYLTRRGAEAKLQELLVEARRGHLAARRVSGATFGDACDEWLRYIEHDRQRRPSTISDYRNAVRGVLEPAFGRDTPLERVTADVIDAWRATQVAEGTLAPRTINKYLANLHAIFKRAQRVFRLPENPVSQVDRQPQRRTGRFDFLEPEEVELLASHAETEQEAFIYTVAAFTGLRLGELRALRWQDVDFAKRLIHVRRGYTRSSEHEGGKSHRVRSVPMISGVAAVLDKLSQRERFTEPEDLVFPNEVGRHFDDSKLRKRYTRALERAGLKRLRFHDLRHTFGTLAVRAYPLADVKAYMGHADISTTMIYVHHVPHHDAADRLEAALGSGLDPRLLGHENGHGIPGKAGEHQLLKALYQAKVDQQPTD